MIHFIYQFPHKIETKMVLETDFPMYETLISVLDSMKQKECTTIVIKLSDELQVLFTRK